MKQRSRSLLRTAASVINFRQMSPKKDFRSAVLAALCGLGVVFACDARPAVAQGKLEAQYKATLAGIPVGRGAWNIDISEDQFSAAAAGGTSGLLKAFAGGSGTASALGRVVNGALVSTNYNASTATSKYTQAI